MNSKQITDAHMAGQKSAGCNEPSFSEALEFFKSQKETPAIGDVDPLRQVLIWVDQQIQDHQGWEGDKHMIGKTEAFKEVFDFIEKLSHPLNKETPAKEEVKLPVILIDDVLKILKENYEACKTLVPEDAARSAQETVNETYEDLIEIFEAKKKPYMIPPKLDSNPLAFYSPSPKEPKYPTIENGFNRGLGSPWDKFIERDKTQSKEEEAGEEAADLSAEQFWHRYSQHIDNVDDANHLIIIKSDFLKAMESYRKQGGKIEKAIEWVNDRLVANSTGNPYTHATLKEVKQFLCQLQ